MGELTDSKIQELVELVGHSSISTLERNQKIREWIESNTRPSPKAHYNPDNCNCGAQHGTIDGDQKCTDNCLSRFPSPKAQIADALTDMRRRGYFDGGLMVQLIAKEMDAGLEDVQKFLNALINVCEGGGE